MTFADELTATGIIRQAFAEHPDLEQRPDLVPAPEPRLRRRRRHLHLHLPHDPEARLRLRRHARFSAACSALPLTWTVAMLALAWSVRY